MLHCPKLMNGNLQFIFNVLFFCILRLYLFSILFSLHYCFIGVEWKIKLQLWDCISLCVHVCVCFVLKLLCIVILKKMRPLAETFNLSVLCDLRLYKTSDSLNFIDFSCMNRMTAEPSHCYPFRIFYCL